MKIEIRNKYVRQTDSGLFVTMFDVYVDNELEVTIQANSCKLSNDDCLEIYKSRINDHE